MDLLTRESNSSDKEIVERIKSGESDLYEVIIRRYNGYLYKVGKSYGFKHVDVEDLMQDAFVNAYVHLNSFQGRSSLKTWLVQIMLHECYHKKHKASFIREMAASENLENKSKNAFKINLMDGVKIVQNQELKNIIEEAILRIGEKYRMVFTLRELMGLSTAETAQALHISDSNVKVRLSRAKEKLRDEIGHKYTPEDLFEFNLVYCDGMVNRVIDEITTRSIYELFN